MLVVRIHAFGLQGLHRTRMELDRANHDQALTNTAVRTLYKYDLCAYARFMMAYIFADMYAPMRDNCEMRPRLHTCIHTNTQICACVHY
jgi:hypothetical protein